MKTKIAIAFALLLIASMACSLFSSAPATSVASTPEVQGSPVGISTQPIDTPTNQTVQPNDTSSPGQQCQPERWKIIPSALYQYPLESGWKYVIAEVAVENGSDFWGSIHIAGTLPDNPPAVMLTTEDNFSYIPSSGFVSLSDQSGSFYDGKIFQNIWFYEIHSLPPGIYETGIAAGGTNNESHYAFGFRVAQTQNHFALHLKNTSIWCTQIPGQNDIAMMPPFDLSLDNIKFPPTPIANTYPNLVETPIVLPDTGTVNFTKVTQEAGVLKLEYTFTNASQGYGTSVNLGGMILGNDGLINYGESSGMFEAGPGETVTGELVFNVPNSINNLTFIYINDHLNVYQAFKLNPD